MIAKEAYEIIKRKEQNTKAIECLEFEGFFAFFLVPVDYDEKTHGGVGGAYITVDKKSGSISTFNPTQDFETFDKAIKINMSTLS